MKRLPACAILGLGLAVLASAASADIDPYASKRGIYGKLVDTPVYDPHSKSYFELVNQHLTYPEAKKYASTKVHRGVRGRLAIIRSRETQEFIVDTFKPDYEAWIGLRMYCHGRVLFWVDGTKLQRGKDYTNWGKAWHYKDKYQPCIGRSNFAGVTLAPERQAGYSGNRLRWYAIGPGHGVEYSIIEYPTGKP